MPPIVWTAPAVADLSNIRQWLLAEAGAQIALDMLGRIRATASRLTEFPLRGPLVTTDLYSLKVPASPYRIVYRVDEGGVLVLRIRHARQDWRPRPGPRG